MLSLKIIAVLITCAGLAACNDSDYEYSAPYINYWEVVDSFGNSNLEYDHHHHGNYQKALYIDPHIDDGYFELWWDVSSHSDYSATIYINDSASLFGSYQLDHTYCGPGKKCDYEGFAYCFYKNTHYDTVSCSTGPYENPEIDITPLISSHPNDLFLLIEVCDNYSGECDLRSQRVTFE